MNTAPLTRFHYDHVSCHTNQTMLVDALLTTGLLDYSEISNAFDPETEEYREIYQWLVFPNFGYGDFEKLSTAGIPVLTSEYGTWVGITSFGSHYDLYVYPELINALFDMDIGYVDVEGL